MSDEVLQDRALEDPQRPEAAEPDSAYAVLPRPIAWVMGFERSALWLGAAIGAGYLLVTAAVVAGWGFAAAGRVPDGTLAEFIAVNVTYAVYWAAVPIAMAILVHGLERDARNLAPAFDAGEGGQTALQRDALTVTPRALWVGGGVGLAMAITSLWIIFDVGVWSPVGTMFLALREITINVAIFAAIGWAVGAATRLSQLTDERARPDLLDPRAFAALARNGTRLAAVWLVLMAIGLPILLVVPEAVAEVVGLMLVMMLGLACLAAVALILPCRGAHRVLRSAKRVELAAVRSQIAEARLTGEHTQLPGLLAWETRIEGVSEWPIDAPALGRTGLFLLLPLASWVGSALVERMVDASIG